jgi:hypothetical protein
VRVIVAVAVVAGLSSCAGHPARACPASATVVLPNVVVQVDAWPGAGSVVLQCMPVCVESLAGDGPAELTAEVVGGVAGFDALATPASVVITVLGGGGTELTSLQTALDWERVGGAEECGGPMQATVTVPAP